MEYIQKDSLKKVENFEKQLDLKMSKSQYLFEAQNFPIKFYDSYSINRLYELIKEERATTLQEVFSLLENQLNVEYQNNLAERNLASLQATERSARITAVSSTISAFNTSKNKLNIETGKTILVLTGCMSNRVDRQKY